MKVLIALAAFVAVSLAAPAPSAVNWILVDAKVETFRTTVKNGVIEVEAIASRDNPIVGADIKRKVDLAEKGMHAALGKIKEGIKSETLTASVANTTFVALQGDLEALRASLAEDIAQLLPETQENLRNTLEAFFTQAQGIAREIVDLLGVPATLAVDWNAVDAKVEEIRHVVSEGVEVVRSTAVADNPVVGGQIARQLNVASGQAHAVLGRVKEAIRARTLSVDQARAFFQELETVLTSLRTDVRDLVAQLSPAAQTTIGNALNNGYAQVEAKANEIYNLLSQ